MATVKILFILEGSSRKSKFWYTTINLLFYHFDCYASEVDLYLSINPLSPHTTFRPALFMMLLWTIHRGL